ncbi:hypothetical protein HanIR_Chr08g0357741 [Helianthus annuus]|nr:hypothetical protein HanIR_Chr08g0357741 [Helianthus annuus]
MWLSSLMLTGPISKSDNCVTIDGVIMKMRALGIEDDEGRTNYGYDRGTVRGMTSRAYSSRT